MVLCEGEKMAKSLGNLILISDLLKKYGTNVIRWFLLMHHYRKPWEFEQAEIEDASRKIKAVEKFLLSVGDSKVSDKLMKQFEEFMEEDLKTEDVLNLVLELSKNPGNKASAKKILEILGFVFYPLNY